MNLEQLKKENREKAQMTISYNLAKCTSLEESDMHFMQDGIAKTADQLTSDTAHAVALAVIGEITNVLGEGMQDVSATDGLSEATDAWCHGITKGNNDLRQRILDHLTTLEAKIKDV